MNESTASALRFPTPVQHSLEAVPKDSRIRQPEVYPDDYFSGGAYVNLPYGRVRYWTLGAEDGRKVVLIHGLTIPAITWKDIAPALAANGFRVLLYDLYGKGYSEAPQVKYDPNLFVTQLALLLQFIGWQKAAIVGFSMGGGIASAFTASLPHLVDGKVVFIASAGIPNSPEEVVRRRPGPPKPIPTMTEIRELQAETLPGYKDAISSLIKHGPLYGLSAAFEKIGKTDIDVLVIHGKDDDVVIHDSAVPGIKNRIPQAKVVSIEGAEHDLLVMPPHWEKVLVELIAFLK